MHTLITIIALYVAFLGVLAIGVLVGLAHAKPIKNG
jgi:hypothetical protein